jgi:hypothetical protein
MVAVHRKLVLLLAGVGLVVAACSGSDDRAEEPVVVPAGATLVTELEHDGAGYEAFADGDCRYVRVTNLGDGVQLVHESCRPEFLTWTQPCLRWEGDGGDDASDSTARSCTSRLTSVVVWGRTSDDRVAYGCVPSGDQVPEARPLLDDFFMLVVTTPSAAAPAFLLADGRGVRGPGVVVPIDDAAAARCRAALGLPEPPLEPRAVALVLSDPAVWAGEDGVLEVTTDTGWLWAAGLAAVVGGPTNEPVDIFADTRALRLRSEDEDGTEQWAFAVDLPPAVVEQLMTMPCPRLVVSVDEDRNGTASAERGC